MSVLPKSDLSGNLGSDALSADRQVLMGIFWVTLGMALLAALAVVVRSLALSGVHPFQLLFFRNAFAALVMMPLLVRRGRSLFITRHLSLYGLRVSISLMGMSAWFYALSLISVGELTAISFLAPLFGTLAAIIFLREVVGIRRWAALLVGFAGAMVILRPGISQIGLGQILALVAACGIGIASVLIKQLTVVDDPDRIVFLTSILLVPLTGVAAFFVWSWPSAQLWPWIVLLGVLAVAGHLALVRGFAAMDASLVLTFEFSRLPIAVALAYWVFGEIIDIWTWIGSAVIFGSAVYIARREVALKRQKKPVTTDPSLG